MSKRSTSSSRNSLSAGEVTDYIKKAREKFYEATNSVAQGAVDSIVEQVLAKLPQQTGGISEKRIRAIVEEAITKLPPSVTMEEVQGLIDAIPRGITEEEVNEKINALPASLTRAEVEQMISDLPVSGGVTEEKVKELIRESNGEGTKMFVNGKLYYSPVMYAWADGWKEVDSDPETKSVWARYAAKFGQYIGVITANRASGEWATDVIDPDFERDMTMMRRFIKGGVLVYVKTQYAAALNPEKYARPGMPTPERFTHEEILRQIDAAFEWYGYNVCGVFLDEMVHDWPLEGQTEADRDAQYNWYKELYQKIKDRFWDGFIVEANPGANTTERMLDCADILMTFEGSFEKYQEIHNKGWMHPSYYRSQPSWRFHHAIHGISIKDIDKAFDILESYNIGHVFMTDKTLIETNPETGEGNQYSPWQHPYGEPPSEAFDTIIRLRLSGFEELVSTQTTTGEGWEAQKLGRNVALSFDGWDGSEFTLPESHRPARKIRDVVFAEDGTTAFIAINENGKVTLTSGHGPVFGTTSYIS